MKEKGKETPRGGRTATFVLILLGFLCISFIGSLVFNVLDRHREKGGKRRSEIRIEVLNGCGVDRLAQEVTQILREKGFDVIGFANAEMKDLEKTVLIDRRSPEMANARIVGTAIGCKNMTSEIDPLLLLEVSVVLGRDYGKFFGRYLPDKGF